ncbi:MAG: substrate-binding domain-containing protein [Opitutales bacterium]
MPRGRTQRVLQVKAELAARARSSFAQPGDAFFSARAVARRFQVSYATAHQLIAELREEGLLERRQGSGTYVAGKRHPVRRAHLRFNARAQRANSFGAFLLARLRRALEQAAIDYELDFDTRGTVPDDAYPIVWETPSGVSPSDSLRYWTLLNDRPVPGLAASFCDSIAVDDFSGGVAAGEILRTHFDLKSPAILAGPRRDTRNQARIEGFQQVFPEAHVVYSNRWELTGASPADRLRRLKADGVFCANDRLAEGLHRYFDRLGRSALPVVGFDDAPVAAQLSLTTIAIPWDEICAATVENVARRLRGDTAAGRLVLLAPRPVFRNKEMRTS